MCVAIDTKTENEMMENDGGWSDRKGQGQGQTGRLMYRNRGTGLPHSVLSPPSSLFSFSFPSFLSAMCPRDLSSLFDGVGSVVRGTWLDKEAQKSKLLKGEKSECRDNSGHMAIFISY